MPNIYCLVFCDLNWLFVNVTDCEIALQQQKIQNFKKLLLFSFRKKLQAMLVHHE